MEHIPEKHRQILDLPASRAQRRVVALLSRPFDHLTIDLPLYKNIAHRPGCPTIFTRLVRQKSTKIAR